MNELAKSDRPETPLQARYWGLSKHWYLDVGWCHTCAAQAAWGHQLGFRRARPPCDDCVGRPARGERATRWSDGRLVTSLPDDRW